jgi:uncharacterized protein with GYD domain
MPKYLFQGSYTEQGLKGVLQEGGSKRREAAEQLLKGMGGQLEAYYYAFGSNDFVIIADLPSNVDAAALSLAVNASGAVASRATVLITPEEVDEATTKTHRHFPRAPLDRCASPRVSRKPASAKTSNFGFVVSASVSKHAVSISSERMFLSGLYTIKLTGNSRIARSIAGMLSGGLPRVR